MISRTLVPSSTTSIPTTFAVPDVGFRIVQRIMRSVVFPEPFGPRITIISPSLTVKFRPRRASVLPYLFERLSVSTANKLGKRPFAGMGDKNVEPRRKYQGGSTFTNSGRVLSTGGAMTGI